MRVEVIDSSGSPEIDSYVLGVPASLVYQTSAFIGLISRYLDVDPLWFVARSGREIVGVLPAVHSKGELGGILNSLAYYGSNGGVVQQEEDSTVKGELVNRFYDHARENHCLAATIINNPLMQDSEF